MEYSYDQEGSYFYIIRFNYMAKTSKIFFIGNEGTIVKFHRICTKRKQFSMLY